MTVIYIKSGSGDMVSPDAGSLCAARGAESAFACITDNVVAMTIGTFVYFESHFKSAACHHSFDFIDLVLRN